MTNTPLYGLDKELAAKQAGKYDPQREIQAKEWIEKVTGEKFQYSFQESLKDGILLCKTINAVSESSKIVPSNSKIAFKQMENINMFLMGLNALGVPKHDQFQTVDLYEGKNMLQVVDTIFALSRHAQKNGFSGDLLGPKLSDKIDYNFTDEQMNQGKSILTLQTSGNQNGANQSGISFGTRRDLGARDPKQ